MNDFELEAYAKQHLRACLKQSETARLVPRRSWRSRAAQVLRTVADGLEPRPVPAARLRA